jgi:membrane protein
MAKQRFTSLLLVIALALVLIISVVVDAVLNALSDALNAWLPFGNVLLMGLSVIVAVVLMTLLFAAIFQFVPARRLPWRELLAGAAATAVLFEIGKFLIGLYLGSQSAASSLGAAGALLGILLWIYYSAQIFLFGAAFTKAHADSAEARL